MLKMKSQWFLLLQISSEFSRFSAHLPDAKIAVVYGGINLKTQKESLKQTKPHIIVGTPGRVLDLARSKDLVLKYVRHFVLDECDKMLESLGNDLLYQLPIIITFPFCSVTLRC